MATKNGQQKAVQSNLNGFFGAGGVTWTRDLSITNRMHYQLCYTSIYWGFATPRILKCNGCQNLIYWDFNIACATCWFFEWVLLITKTVRHLTTPCKSRVLTIFFWCHDAIVAQLFAPNHCFLAKITVTCHRAFSLLKIILNMWELHYSPKKLQ